MLQIPRNILENKYHGRHTKSVDRPKILTHKGEQLIFKTFCVVANWGFPLIKHNIMEAIKSSLSLKRDKQNFKYWQRKLILRNKTSFDDKISAFIQRKK